MWAKWTRACISACRRGWSSLRPGMRLPVGVAVVAHVLLDEAAAVVTADDRVGQVHVLDLGLQLAAIMLGDLAAEDDGDLVRLTDRAVGVEQTLTQLVERGAPVKDQVV